MPQMSPYNWLLLNLMFSSMFLMFMIILNFISIKKLFFKKKKINKNFLIKW
uniref:ATP synthase F0 subunit 8 n=1 Tax=Hyposoter sp. ZJUH_2016018 TaxID=2491160 RepID=A0A3S8V0Q7_9HYME|nr:ATP synthase F0 subunit 8 [Hyposoter sp. ZJUH_2016018]